MGLQTEYKTLSNKRPPSENLITRPPKLSRWKIEDPSFNRARTVCMQEWCIIKNHQTVDTLAWWVNLCKARDFKDVFSAIEHLHLNCKSQHLLGS